MSGRGASRAFVVFVALASTWILVVTVLILREPDPGAPSRQELVAQAQSAVRERDAHALAVLIRPGFADDGYAVDLLTSLPEEGSATVVGAPRGRPVTAEVLARENGATICVVWRIVDSESRYFLDPRALAGPRSCG